MSVLFVKILFIILIKINAFAFIKTKTITTTNQLIRSNKYMHIMMDPSVCFPEEDDYNKKINNMLIDKLYYLYDNDYDYEDYFSKPLYTLVWHDCEKCKRLLNHMELLKLKKIYVNTNYDFNTNYDLQNPLLFKDDKYISDDLFEIYEEIYKN